MKKRHIKLKINLKLPNGETPDIDADWKADKKIDAALSLLLNAGAEEYGFIVNKMDIQTGVAFVLTYNGD